MTSSGQLVADLETNILPAVLARHPGVTYSFEGIQAEQQDAVDGLQVGFATALLAIFALLAIPLKSYVQPLIIMGAIPFGLVGAVWGHMLLGLDVPLFTADWRSKSPPPPYSLTPLMISDPAMLRTPGTRSMTRPTRDTASMRTDGVYGCRKSKGET